MGTIVLHAVRQFLGYYAGSDGCIFSGCKRLKPWRVGKGYLAVALRRNGKTVKKYVHHLVAEAFIGPRPDGMDVCHNNGNRLDNYPENLRYDTRSGNLADRDRHGTHQRGQQNPRAKLTDAEAGEIRTMREAGCPLKTLAELFHVRESTVSRIVNGKRRKGVEGGQKA